MKRSDGPAIRDTVIWLGLMVVFAGIGAWLWPPGGRCPFFLAYGVLYGSATDSRWHECGHGTAFRTPWMNDAVYQIACFMIMREPGDLALEPHAPPHRHDHRRPRPGDRGDAPARRRSDDPRTSSASRHVAGHHPGCSCNASGRLDRRGGDLHPGERAAEGRSASRASGWRSTSRSSRSALCDRAHPAAACSSACPASTAPGIHIVTGLSPACAALPRT